MILETVKIMKRAIAQGLTVNIPVNNRDGGKAPLIAMEIAVKFMKIKGN
jgi:hypothetical protein